MCISSSTTATDACDSGGSDVSLATVFQERAERLVDDMGAAIETTCCIDSMQKEFQALLKLYGEDPNCTLQGFFGSLATFLDLLRKTRLEMEEKRVRTARRQAVAAREAAAAAAATAGTTSAGKAGRRRGLLAATASPNNSKNNRNATDLAAALGKIRSCVKPTTSLDIVASPCDSGGIAASRSNSSPVDWAEWPSLDQGTMSAAAAESTPTTLKRQPAHDASDNENVRPDSVVAARLQFSTPVLDLV